MDRTLAGRLAESVLVGTFAAIILALGGYVLKNIPFLHTDIFHIEIVTLGEIVLWLQVIALGVITLAMVGAVPLRLPPVAAPEKAGAKKAAEQFIAYWLWVWVFLLAFYVLAALGWRTLMSGSDAEPWMHVGQSICYVGSTTVMLLCYFILTTKSTMADDLAEWHRVLIQILLVSAAMVIISLFPIPSSSAAAPGEGPYTMLADALGMLPKFFCGVVLALFVGRLESKLMGTRRWIVIALYCYALLQVAYVEPDPHSPGVTFSYLTVVALSLGLKILLFIEVARLIRSGALTNYMFEYRRMLDERGA